MTVSAELRAKIAELRASGQTVRAIAAALKIGKSTVSSILKTPPVHSPDIITHVPVEEMSISEVETTSFLKTLEPQVIPPEKEQKAFLRDLAMSLRAPPAEDAEPPVRRVKAPKNRSKSLSYLVHQCR